MVPCLMLVTKHLSGVTESGQPPATDDAFRHPVLSATDSSSFIGFDDFLINM